MRAQMEFETEEEEQVDFKKLLATTLRYWYLPVLGVLLGLGTAFLYLKFTTPMYKISSKLLIKDDKKGPDLNGNAIFGELESFKSINNMDNEVEVLNSESLMQRVLGELSLQVNYWAKDRFRERELYGHKLPLRVIIEELDSAALDKTLMLSISDKQVFELTDIDELGEETVTSYQFGQKIKKPYGSFTVVQGDAFQQAIAEGDTDIIIRFNNLRKMATYYNRMIHIEPVSKTASVVLLTLTDPVPQKGKDIINKLVELYNQEAIEDKNFIATNTIAFLDERLGYLTEELKLVEKDVENYKRSKVITNVNTQAHSYAENASEYKRQQSDLSIQVDILESIESYLQQQGDEYELVPSTLGIKDPTLMGLITRFNELQLERERMLRTTQANNPLVRDLNEQLGSLRGNILENLRNIKNSLIITRNKLEDNSGQYAYKMQEVPSIERHLLEISRQQGIKQGLYLHLLQKREESALALAATVSSIRIIDPAIAGDGPASPNRTIVLALALLLGFGLPLGIIYLKMITNNKVQERKDVTVLTSTPILGEIAHNSGRKVLVVTDKSRTPVAEMFRLLRINLNFSTVGMENQVIMVTSSMSGEGKTFFCINLAASLALTGKRVAVLDLDLRNPSVLQDIGMPATTGVTDYIISKEVTIDDIVRPVKAVPGLYMIGTGPLPPNPAEFAMSPKLGQLIHELKENFDQIIIDTAPIGQVSDAFLLAPYIDNVLYIVRYNITLKSQLGIINDIYKEKKLKNPLIVLNDAKKENGYGYGYGYGYGDKKSRKHTYMKSAYV
jgi:tyrosine-protein kinase Etk/Wzc